MRTVTLTMPLTEIDRDQTPGTVTDLVTFNLSKALVKLRETGKLGPTVTITVATE